MQGAVSPPEWKRYQDPLTGRSILQWTSGQTMNHHLYFTNPSVSADGNAGFFVSYRSGHPNLFRIDLESGRLQRLTDRNDMNPFSPVLASNGPLLYFSARDRIYWLDTDSGESGVLAAFPGGKIGNCSLSRDCRLLAVGIRRTGYCELAVVETWSGKSEICLRAEEVGHVQFCPADSALLLFSGPPRKRLWCHDRCSGRVWRVLGEKPDEWFIHETWLGKSSEIVFVRWPHALLAVRPDGDGLRELLQINAWHPCSDAEGSRVVFDTNNPDRGIVMLELRSGETTTLCLPGASQRGEQWGYDLPAEGAGIDISIIRSDSGEGDPPPRPEDPPTLYGPQWTHPHPSFSPDGKQVVFTSDRDRYAHVYALDVSVNLPGKAGAG